MLSVLSFKQSMFAGVLDGGMSEVFLGGTRLKRFMESVDKVSQSIPEPMPAQADGADRRTEEDHGAKVARAEIPAPPDWAELISAGQSFLDKLGRALSTDERTPVELGGGVKIETDAATGRRHLKLPAPSKEILQGIAGLLNQWAERL